MSNQKIKNMNHLEEFFSSYYKHFQFFFLALQDGVTETGFFVMFYSVFFYNNVIKYVIKLVYVYIIGNYVSLIIIMSTHRYKR